jgi:hypothetical protein
MLAFGYLVRTHEARIPMHDGWGVSKKPGNRLFGIADVQSIGRRQIQIVYLCPSVFICGFIFKKIG